MSKGRRAGANVARNQLNIFLQESVETERGERKGKGTLSLNLSGGQEDDCE